MDLNRPFEGDIDFFEGHIQRMTHKQFNRYQPETDHDSQRQIQFNNMMEGNEIKDIDVLAYYISPHVSQADWGIYFLERGINWLTSYFENRINNDPNGEVFMTMPGAQKTPQEIHRDLINFSKKKLLRHELGHYAIDYSLTRCDTINSNDYHHFRAERQIQGILLDESICNANVGRKKLKISNRLPGEPKIGFDLDMNPFCNEFMDSQPLAYRGYRQFMTLSYSETCVDALNSIVGVNFNTTDFNEAIRDSSAMSVPLYVVSI
ncbi:MAG: hypothetical protein HOB51_07475 [Thaumarchaeota archaeon]|nr:hypothetical protein [Nitrososphaerota archaeon]